MNRKEFLIVIRKALNELLQVNNINVPIIRGNQSTKVGVPDEFISYFELGDKALGYAQREYHADHYIENQPIAVTLQFGAVIKNDPKNMDQLTSAELMKKFTNILQSLALAQLLIEKGIGVIEISPVTSTYTPDEGEDYQQQAIVTVGFTYTSVTRYSINYVDNFEGITRGLANGN